MNRRNFMRSTAPLAVVPFFSNQLFAAALPHTQLDQAMLGMLGPESDRILVIVQMSGGNDGLNMVLGLDQYSNLAAARSNILVPDTSALMLGSTQTGLHPSMTGLKGLFDEGKLSIIQGVSYANPNFSHFRATDIFNTGSDSVESLTTGWIGRYLEYAFPGFPDAYPSTLMPDPLSIRIGSSNTLGLQGYEISTGQTVPSNFSGSLTQLLSYQNTNLPTGNAATELAFLRGQQSLTNQYGTRIVNAWTAGTNAIATYPTAAGGQNLPAQLKIVARLIKGGLKTRVYWVSMGGFDTHATQVVSTDKRTGTHANLLKELSDSIATFQSDLTQMGLEDRVIGMTFSEFGRRIISNGSAGTDHGVAAPMFVFGKKITGRIIGSNPVIPAVATSSSQVAMQYDFKSIYQSILQGWFCMPTTNANTVLGDVSVPNVPINGGCITTALPVELVRFAAERANEQDASLSWSTASENGTETFEIERSLDVKSFEKVGIVAANGHSHGQQSYTFIDKNLPLTNTTIFYYRLKIKDFDGSSNFSPTRSVTFEVQSKTILADVSPNPSSGRVALTFKGGIDLDKMTEISITDMSGRSLAKFSENYAADSVVNLDLTTVPSGIYLVLIKNGTNSLVKRIIIQH